MSKRIAVMGYGAVGRALVPLLVARGDHVTIVQRSTPANVPDGAQFRSANLKSRRETIEACAGFDTVVCAVGIPYSNRQWVREWPVIMRNLLKGCEKAGARFVFADNLYMYGPQSAPLCEDMPLTRFGRKPRVRADITKLWQKAHQDGKVKAVAVRASDFFGPGVANSVISAFGIARLVAGKPAQSTFPVDLPHDFTYVPDFARALVSLIDAPDSDYGQAWHVPNPPTRSLREILTHAAELSGVKPRISVVPAWLRAILGLFSAPLHAMAEMSFQWDGPYIVDSSRFASRFWSDATPWDISLAQTVNWYRAHQDQ